MSTVVMTSPTNYIGTLKNKTETVVVTATKSTPLNGSVSCSIDPGDGRAPIIKTPTKNSTTQAVLRTGIYWTTVSPPAGYQLTVTFSDADGVIGSDTHTVFVS